MPAPPFPSRRFTCHACLHAATVRRRRPFVIPDDAAIPSLFRQETRHSAVSEYTPVFQTCLPRKHRASCPAGELSIGFECRPRQRPPSRRCFHETMQVVQPRYLHGEFHHPPPFELRIRRTRNMRYYRPPAHAAAVRQPTVDAAIIPCPYLPRFILTHPPFVSPVRQIVFFSPAAHVFAHQLATASSFRHSGRLLFPPNAPLQYQTLLREDGRGKRCHAIFQKHM